MKKLLIMFSFYPLILFCQNKDCSNFQNDILRYSKENSLDGVRCSIEKGAKIDSKTTLSKEIIDGNKIIYSGATPLIIASKIGNLDMVKLLVEKGNANVNVKDSDNITPLMEASAGGYLKIADYLLSKKANINDLDSYGWSALTYAVFENRTDVARLLVGKGINVNTTDSDGLSPLAYSSLKGDFNMVALIVGSFGDLNNQSGTIALINACSGGYMAIVQYLVGKGVDINNKDKTGLTPFIAAAFNGHVEVLKFLFSKGAKINEKISLGEFSGKTALSLAVLKEKADAVDYLKSINAK